MASKPVPSLEPTSNDAESLISFQEPYLISASVHGTAPFLFHRWSVESIEEKSKAAKGSKAKKMDDVESYVYRDDKGHLAIPSEYFRQSCINAAKFKQDPRSPRKSAMDLFKAALACEKEYCTITGNKAKWDYVDQRRVMVQRNGVTRSRPALEVGWETKVEFSVLLPEYVDPRLLNDVLQMAGRLVGVGDNRPSYGRFQITEFKVLELR
jgi:hypothetical protein